MHKKNRTVLNGEVDQEGKLKVPHTCYGLVRNAKFMFQQIWKYRKALIPMFIIGAITQSVMRYLWSYIAKFLIDIIQAQAENSTKDLSPLIWMLVITSVVELVSLSGDSIIQNRVWFRFRDVRNRLVTEKNEKLLSMRYQTLEQPHILDLHQRANNALSGDWQGIGGMMSRSFRLSAYFITMVVTATTIIVLDPRLILVLTVAMFLNYASQRWSIRDDKKHFWDETSTIRRKISYMEYCTQNFQYAKDIRVFSLSPWLLKKQRGILSEYEKKYMVSRNIWLRHSYIYSTTSLISAGVMYYVLITQVLKQNISIGDFTLYLGLCAAFSSALSDFYDDFGQLQQASTLVDDYRTFMDLPEESLLMASKNGEAQADLQKTKEKLSTKELSSKKLNFELRDVCFRYDGAKEDTIKNLNLNFSAGQKLAIVGLNGAGKTTFVKLLLRLYDITAGEILLNGVSIYRYEREEYYRLFAPLFQNVELFAFPMFQNVSMKRPEETDRKMAEQCLQMAGLSEKLQSLEKGGDTELLKVLYDDGVDLSGGEKQKLALARALYKDAPVIVLDEPTAALDAIAEYELYQHFDRMIGAKSAIFISHRLSSTRFCDRILMFENGQIIESGTHEQLLEKGGAYARLFEVQAQYYKEENRGGNEDGKEQ